MAPMPPGAVAVAVGGGAKSPPASVQLLTASRLFQDTPASDQEAVTAYAPWTLSLLPVLASMRSCRTALLIVAHAGTPATLNWTSARLKALDCDFTWRPV